MQALKKMRIWPLIIHVVLYVPILAALAKILSWEIFIPVALVVTCSHIYLTERWKRRRFRVIVDTARSTRIEGFSVLSSTENRPMDDVLIESLREVSLELERKCYQLVEKNIQLLSLKEISVTLISSLNESRIVDSVQDFLCKGLGFKEVFVGIYKPESKAFNMYTFRETFGRTSRQERIVRIEDMDGLLKKSLVTRKPVLIRDPEMHSLGAVNGEEMFKDSTMDSYLVVPMVKSAFSQKCGSAANCVLNSAGDDDEVREDSVCPACGRLPVLGLLGVTDGFKAASLSQVDLVAVETLALQISTLLENSQLYADLQNEESFRDNVINSMLNGLVTVDNEGTILLANSAAESLSGYEPEELVGMRVESFIIDAVQDRERSPIVATLRGRRAGPQREAWLIAKDGRRMPILLHTSLLIDEEKQIQGALGVFVDITRIKRMEKKIQHLDKLAALGRFSSSMAHEIRNPLTGIVAGLQYLRRAGAIPKDQSENIDFILREVNRIDRLISDILSVVRVGPLVYHPVEVESLVKCCVTGVSDLADAKSVSIQVSVPDKPRSVMLDSDRMTQVMLNLLKNAVEASHEGGEIRVGVSFPLDVTDVLFDDMRNLVIIEVEDDGVGFSEEQKERIFEPFFTTKSNGTGLGLYVTHSIIERHDGYIFVETEEGKGSVFTVYLPVEKVEHGDASEISHPLGR